MEVFGVAPAGDGDLTEATAACRNLPCFRTVVYNYALNTTTTVISTQDGAILDLVTLTDVQPDVPPHLAALEVEIARTAPEVQQELQMFPAAEMATMEATKTNVNDSRCERSRHLCVAPVFLWGERALHTVAAWDGKSWEPWAEEGWILPDPAPALTPDGALLQIGAEGGPVFQIVPGNADNAFVYVTQYKANEGDADLPSLGSCCREDVQQGPDTFIEPEALADSPRSGMCRKWQTLSGRHAGPIAYCVTGCLTPRYGPIDLATGAIVSQFDGVDAQRYQQANGEETAKTNVSIEQAA